MLSAWFVVGVGGRSYWSTAHRARGHCVCSYLYREDQLQA